MVHRDQELSKMKAFLECITTLRLAFGDSTSSTRQVVLLESLRLSPLVLALSRLIVAEGAFCCWLRIIVHGIGIFDTGPYSFSVWKKIYLIPFILILFSLRLKFLFTVSKMAFSEKCKSLLDIACFYIFFCPNFWQK